MSGIADLHATDLLLVADATHTTSDALVLARIVEAVSARLPEVTVHLARIDPRAPDLTEMVARLAETERRVAVVPLLLNPGYLVEADVRRAVAPFPQAAVSASLGPHPRLATVLVDRLLRAGATWADSIVLAASASSRPCSTREVEAMTEMLADRWGRPIRLGLAAAEPLLESVVATARRTSPSGRVVIASYLVTDGLAGRRFRNTDADLVTGPLADHTALIDLVLSRYSSVRNYLDSVVPAAV